MRRLLAAFCMLAALALAACGPATASPAPTHSVDAGQASPTQTRPPAEKQGPTPTPERPTPTSLSASPSPTADRGRKPTPAPVPTPAGARASRTVTATVEPLPSADAYVTAASFADARHGFLALGKLLLATEDGGERWAERGRLDGSATGLDFVSPERGWAATEAGLLATEDAGKTWRRADLPAAGDVAGPATRVDFADAGHGWVSAGAEILRTTDAGKTWTAMANPCDRKTGPAGPFSFTGPEGGYAACGGVPGAGQQAKQLFRTDDGGGHWQLSAQTAALASDPAVPTSLPTSGYVSDLFFHDDAHGWLALSRGGLLATADGGRSWRRVPVSGDGEEFVRHPRFVSPDQGYVVSAMGRGALLGTRDGGATWTQLYPSSSPSGPLAHFDARRGLGAGTLLDPGAILQTADAGRTWQQVASLRGEHVLALSFPDPAHGWAIAERSEAGGIVRTLYRTVDGGRTWASLSSVSDPKELYTYLSFVDARTGYVGSGWGHLAVTHDGGATFQPVDSQDSKSASFEFASEEDGWKIADLSLWATADGGKTWARVPLAYQVMQFDLMPGGGAWVVVRDCGAGACRPGLLSTDDGGKTWTRHDLGAVEPATATFADAAHGWLAAEEGHLYSTDDGGQTWAQLR